MSRIVGFLKYLFGWAVSTAIACLFVSAGIFIMSRIFPDKYAAAYERVTGAKRIIENPQEIIEIITPKPSEKEENAPRESSLEKTDGSPRISETPSAAAAPAAETKSGIASAVATVVAAVKREAEAAQAVRAQYVADAKASKPETYEEYDGPDWAIVAVPAAVYAEDRTKTDKKYSAGVFLETGDEIFWPNGCVYFCRELKDGKPVGDGGYVYKSDLACFPGPFTAGENPDRDLVSKYCALREQYETLRAKRRRQMIKRNPYFSEYKKRVAELRKLSEDSEKIYKQYENASGTTRERFGDELRKLKYKQNELMPKYTEIERKYKEWRRKNFGTDSDDIKVPDTPEMKRINAEMGKIADRVNEICPGI